MHDKHKIWIDGRGIDPELAEKFGLDTVFRDGKAWLAVPYLEAGKVINHKYRFTSGKDHRMDEGAPLTLWNVDCLSAPEVVSGQAEVVITEGEWDALAALTAGKKFVVSVPNGAPSSVTDEPENAKRYDWVHRHLDLLDKVKTFVLATDGDGPGRALAADLAAMLGPERCKFITYPEGCKDLNDVALGYSHAMVVETIDSAKPYPVKGLYTMDDFPERGDVVTYPIGIKALEGRIAIVPGTLTVVTGFANMGKTTLIDSITAGLLELNIPVCRADFETMVKPIMHNDLRRALMRCNSFDLCRIDTSYADSLIRDNLTIIAQNVDEENEMDLTEFLGLCRMAVIRHGVKVIILDPWNELEHKMRPGEPETVYTSRALKAIKRFAATHDVAFFIIVHPSKPDRAQNKDRAPGLYDASGCHSEDTEVLTKRGWLTHDKLSFDDEVACFNLADNSLTYQRPTRIIRQPFSGELYRFKGYGFDQLVTPDHRMVIKPKWKEPVGSQSKTGIGRPIRWEKGKWAFCEARELPSAPFSIPLAAPLKDACLDEVTAELAHLAGWFVSEGTWSSSGVGIAQAADTAGAHKIEALLGAMSIPYAITRSGPGGKGGKLPGNTYYIGVRGAREVVTWLRENCGKGSANKRVPAAIMEGTAAVKRAFLSSYLDGDGHLRTRGTYSATTTSAELRDQLQRLAIELGFSCCWHERPPQSDRYATSWMLSFGREERSETAIRTYRSMTREAYEGDVWCLTVPTGAYVTRRNGKASISGNSAHWANKADYGLTYHRPKPDENKAYIIVNKVRKGLPGKKGSVVVTYDWRTSEFKELDTEGFADGEYVDVKADAA